MLKYALRDSTMEKTSSADLKKKIAAEFKVHRKELGLSQHQAAKLLGLQRTSVTNIENNNQSLSAHDWQYFKQFKKSDFYTDLFINKLKTTEAKSE